MKSGSFDRHSGLNADPIRYPPPQPTVANRARHAWGKTSVYEILSNPKYTGYQVFNRSRRSHLPR